MDISLRLLRHALTLAEHRNFPRAAVALGISQPALSRSMQNLERTVGAVLFDRRPQGVEPTDAGQLLLLRARELLSFSEEFVNEVSRTNSLHRGRIVCGAGPYPAETVVASAMVCFAAVLTADNEAGFGDLRKHQNGNGIPGQGLRRRHCGNQLQISLARVMFERRVGPLRRQRLEPAAPC